MEAAERAQAHPVGGSGGQLKDRKRRGKSNNGREGGIESVECISAMLFGWSVRVKVCVCRGCVRLGDALAVASSNQVY